MVLNDRQLPVLPAVNGAVAVAVLVHQSDMFQDVPLLVMRLQDRFVLINLSQARAHRIGVEVSATALQLMPPERGFHHPTALVPGFACKEFVGVLVVFIGPPAEAIPAFASCRFGKGLHFQVHVHMQHLLITEGVLPAGAPDPEVATKPPAQVAVHLDGRRRGG